MSKFEKILVLALLMSLACALKLQPQQHDSAVTLQNHDIGKVC